MPSHRSLVIFAVAALTILSTVSAAAIQRRGLPNTPSEVKDLPVNVNPSALGNTDIGNTAQLIPAGSSSLVKIGDDVVTDGTNLVTTADSLVGSVSNGEGKRDVPALPLSSLEEKFRVAQETLDTISKEMDAAIADKAALPTVGILKPITDLLSSLLSTLTSIVSGLLGSLTGGITSNLGGSLGGILEPGKPFPTAAASTFVKTAVEIVSKAQNALGPNVPLSTLTQTPVVSAIDGLFAVIFPRIEDKEVLLNVVCPMMTSSYFATLSKFCSGS